MLLKDYKEITEIDGQIEFLHSQLTALYELRANLFGAPIEMPTLPTNTKQKNHDWTKTQYESLKAAWNIHNVQIPTFKTLSAKLKKAEKLFDTLQKSPETTGKFELVLVPPTASYVPQSFDVADVKIVKTWKLYAVYNRMQGIKIEDHASFAKQKGMQLADMNMQGLNAREYAVFLDLHADDLFDLNTWSMLPKELANHEILCVSNMNDTYYCMEDDILAPLGDNYFRPAVEIK